MADYVIAAKAQDINFVNKFETDLHNLMAILAKTEVEVMAPGTAFKTYATSGALSSQTVAEKGLIPDSGIAVGDASIVEITYKKYRNLVGIESIGKKGFDVAVGGSNTKMLKLVQKNVRKSIIDALAVSGSGSADASTFQAKIAKAAAYVQKKFEDEACTPVFFANPDDAYAYLGAASVNLAQNFGLSYLENFMGIGNVIIDSNVPSGTIYGTACENLALVAADVAGIEGLDMQMDESGLIAVHTSPAYANGSIETVVYTGLTVKPIVADCIVAVTTTA